MTARDAEPRRRRASTLWFLALAVVIADAAIWFAGISFGVMGMVVAIAVVIWTQCKADGYWRAQITAPSDSTV